MYFSFNDSTNVLDEGSCQNTLTLAKSIKNFTAISDILLMGVWIFCDGSNKDESSKQTGREGHIPDVTEFHNS